MPVAKDTTVMKVLWLSNKVLSEGDDGATGTWLEAMAHCLVHSGELQLGNISLGSVEKRTRRDFGRVLQWVIPSAPESGRDDGLPPAHIIADVVAAVEEFSPDLVHVWGTEGFWGLLTARNLVRKPAVLETQGLKGAIAKVFHGGLTFREQLSCIGLKEILRGTTVFQERSQFGKWRQWEREIIAGHRTIVVQTEWIEAQVKAINPGCHTHFGGRVLREPFYRAAPWQFQKNAVIFCSVAYPSPFKGLHIAIRAVAILKGRLPEIRLRIAGLHQKAGIRQDGYIVWLRREVERLGVGSNVEWVGPLTATRLVEEMHSAAAMVLPAFIENCSNSMQEAMLVGVPLVASYAGGLPSLARDEESALFFPPGDEAMCAYQLERLLIDRGLAERLSCRARAVALARNDRERLAQGQVEIYKRVLADANGDRRTAAEATRHTV